jgi:hypothetical protein
VLGLFLELVLEVFQQSVIEILATQMSVTGSSFDSKNTSTDIEEGDIKCSPT